MAKRAPKKQPAAAPAADATTSAAGLRIVRLSAENVKRIVAVEIIPQGDVVVLAGANGSGKSSVLDAIEMTLFGKSAMPAEPIRRGAEHAESEIDLGAYVVRRTYTGKDSYLTVKAKDGTSISSPQQLLETLVSRVSFDPMEFIGMKPRDQVDALKRVAGLDFSKLDAERAKAFEDRTVVNRLVKQHEGTVATLGPRRVIPAATGEDPATLRAEAERRRTHNRGVADKRDAADKAERTFADWSQRTNRQAEEVGRLEALLATAVAELGKLRTGRDDAAKAAEAARLEADALLLEDVESIDNKLGALGSHSDDLAHNRQVDAAEEALKKERAESERLTAVIDGVDERKRTEIAAARLPIAGLGFNDDGVTFGGIPFEQVNTADKIKTSVALGLAIHSQLKVLLIRNGNDLDAWSLSMIARMAHEAGAQVWIERIGESGPVSVIIADGTVSSTPNQPVPLGPPTRELFTPPAAVDAEADDDGTSF